MLINQLLKWCNRGDYPLFSFTLSSNSGYDAPTTNYSAVNPNRHSLDIFMPKICLINYQQITTGINKLALRFKRHTYATGHSAVRYGGISEPNKTPLVGNKLRRLNTIVNILPLPFFKHHHQTTTNYSGGYHA